MSAKMTNDNHLVRDGCTALPMASRQYRQRVSGTVSGTVLEQSSRSDLRNEHSRSNKISTSRKCIDTHINLVVVHQRGDARKPLQTPNVLTGQRPNVHYNHCPVKVRPL
jgi:hypothetical protein